MDREVFMAQRHRLCPLALSLTTWLRWSAYKCHWDLRQRPSDTERQTWQMYDSQPLHSLLALFLIYASLFPCWIFNCAILKIRPLTKTFLFSFPLVHTQWPKLGVNVITGAAVARSPTYMLALTATSYCNSTLHILLAWHCFLPFTLEDKDKPVKLFRDSFCWVYEKEGSPHMSCSAVTAFVIACVGSQFWKQ